MAKVIVTACRNRYEDLRVSLPSWLEAPVDRILIADFTSEVSIKSQLVDSGFLDKRIEVVRTEGAEKWVLSWAYNSLMGELGQDDVVIKIDSDDSISQLFLEDFESIVGVVGDDEVLFGNYLQQTRFPSSNYPSSGFFICKGASLVMVGGFNNFILTYGWDDIDLYERFRSAGLCLIDAPAGILNSISHGSDKRFGQQFSANYLQDVSPVNGVCSLPLRELSNFFNRYVAYLTRSVELPDGFIFFSWSKKLEAVGSALLREGLDLNLVYYQHFSDLIDDSHFRKFLSESLYFSALSTIR